MYREFKRKLLAYKREKENGTNAPTAPPPHPSVVKTQIPATQGAQQPATQGPQAAATQGAQQPATQGPQAAATQGKQKLTEEQKKRMKEEYEKLQKMIEETKAMLNNLQVKPQDPLVLERQRKIKSIISGDLSMDYPSTTKVVRIFTSSTFTDTKYERNRLMEHAYPRMKEFCQMKGYEFQVVDMRWGIQHEAANDHSTVDLCLQELRNCQRLSTGPNFVSLLSHKYGYRTLNRQIDVTEFEALLGYEGMDQNTRNLLKRWYKKDENACPPEYVLLPINHNIPQYLSQNEDEQKTAKDQWWKESEEMVLALREASGKLLSEKDASKYTISVTEIETQAGVLESKEPNKHCLWYHRVIDNIEDQPRSYQLSRFIGIDPQLPEHSQYLDKMASDFESRMMTMIEKSIDERENHDQYLNKPLHRECVQHLQFCQEKLKGFYGDSKEPLVIHGLSGCGKTCIVAAAAQKAFESVKGKGAVILRFLGTTPDSSDVVSLLHSLIEHIYRLLVQPYQRVQGSVKLLKARFKQSVLFLRKKADQKFVIILDSVDQLDASNDGRQVLSWILKTLPENVKIIISTLENKEYEAFPLLKAELPEQSFVNVPDFSLDGAIEIIDHWSKDRKRQLTQLQKAKLIDAFKSFSLPLFLKLSAEKAFQWRSFRPENNILFETNIKEAIHALFGRIEKRHGRTLVSHALGYITTAKLGMSEAELEDVLSCDDEVLNNVYQYWTPPVRRLPPLLLVRLRASLQQYLVERGVDGIKVLYWYHRQFIETARERYLSDPITVQKLHQGLADFLSGKWANESAKPFTTKKGEESSAIRYVSAQPIKRGDTYNIRKLNNLPYHLIKGNISVLEDFQLARAAFPADQQISTLGDTLYLSWKALQFDARQFTAQFIDRLSHDKNLASFVEDCRAHPVPYLKATKDFLIRPGGPLTYSLPGHSGAFLNGLDLCKREDGTLIAATGIIASEFVSFVKHILKVCEIFTEIFTAFAVS
ncbi:hypothetical protein FSP39_019955 [Pinctada imbricata]|uniref:NACHT domain-containing protein n=1 Tax=Pinctada imbricata TaxID=66713 RepID=A0AA88Y1L4_PINIB|nr:hypothetical protein FSP39_019955 [Pinctada imbricata]